MDAFPLPTSNDHDQSPTQLDGILAVRRELETTSEKLQQYNDIIISQANELKILRSIICVSCKRKLVEATIAPSPTPRWSSKEYERQRHGQPGMKAHLPGSSSIKFTSSPPIQVIPTPSRGSSRTGLDASPQRSAASMSRPSLHMFNPTGSPSKPPRTGSSSKLPLHPAYRTAGPANHISSNGSAGGSNDSESSWSAIHSPDTKPSISPDLRVRSSKLVGPPSKLPRRSALHRARPSQQLGTTENVPSISSVVPTFTLTRSPESETSNDNNDSEPPWSLTHSSDTMSSMSPSDLLTFQLNDFPTEPPETGSGDHESESPWSITRNPNTKQALDVTFKHAFPHNDRVNCVKFSKDGRYIAVGVSGGESNKWHGKAIIYCTETGMEHCQLVEHVSREKKPGVDAVCFSPNGEQLAIGHKDGHISLWLIDAKRVRNMLRGAGDQLTVTSLDFSPNGRIVVSASLDGMVRIWSLRDGSSKQKLVTTGYTDLRVTFSPIGGYVAAGTGDGGLCILDTRSRELVKRWEGHQNDVSSLVFTPDGNGLLSSSFDGTVKHWDVSSLGEAPKQNTPRNLGQFGGHPHHVRSIAISGNGQWVLCGLDDSSARIWNMSNGMQECDLHGHTRRVWSVDMSPVGNYLALGDIDGRVSLWRTKEAKREVVC